ncbi:MAG: hypothetical protein DHS20C14_11570 [Phycisphaeraceae bacterium]|nr:MAG: hypothetical protein DHS20C14_11570 [Phycisphaeraceae bacterium]
MSHALKAALFGGALCCAGIAQAKDTYRIYGPSTTATNNAYYAWNGSRMTDFSYALTSAYNYYFTHYNAFVDTKIHSTNVDYLATYDVLQRADCIVSPWWSDSETSGNEAYYAAYHFRNGGDLLLFNDDSSHDYIAEYLGIPTISGVSSGTFTDSTFPFDGPFGNPGVVQTSGNVGHLDLADVVGTGGQVLALNGSGQVMAAFWDDNAYAPGSGRMIIVTDVDTVSDLGPSTYSPLSAQGRFGLNLVAGLIGADPCNPADCDANGVLNVDDVECFVDTFLGGCP